MSDTELYRFGKNGLAKFVGEAPNSHLFAPYIWQKLGEKYGITKPNEIPVVYDADKLRKTRALVSDLNTAEHERIVLAATFDYAVIAREEIPRLVDALKKFIAEFPYPHFDPPTDDTFLVQFPKEFMEKKLKGNIVVLIEMLEQEAVAPATMAVGFNITSTNSGWWEVTTTGKNGRTYYRAYNIKTDTKHFMMFQQQ